MADYPALSMWTDAYLADTGDLTLEEHGTYTLMLYLAWRRPDNALLNDMEWLRRALGAHARFHGHTFNAVGVRMLQRFWFLDPQDGKWHQKRLDRERDRRVKLSSNASQSALKRWSNDGQSVPKDPTEPNLFNHLPDAKAYASNPTHTQPIESTDRVLPSSPVDNSKSRGGNGTGNGKAGAHHVTIEDPVERNHRFTQKIAKVLGPAAWDIIKCALEHSHDPHHRASVEICRRAAAQLGKGWPRQWPCKC